MTIIRDEHAPRFDADGVVVTGLASPSRGCASISAWRVVLADDAHAVGSSRGQPARHQPPLLRTL